MSDRTIAGRIALLLAPLLALAPGGCAGDAGRPEAARAAERAGFFAETRLDAALRRAHRWRAALADPGGLPPARASASADGSAEGTPVVFGWAGPAEEAARELAGAMGRGFREEGEPPLVPRMVFLDGGEEPIAAEAAVDMLDRAVAPGAGTRIDPADGTLAWRYGRGAAAPPRRRGERLAVAGAPGAGPAPRASPGGDDPAPGGPVARERLPPLPGTRAEY